MENDKFNQKLSIIGLGNCVVKEVAYDYERIVEWCNRRISEANASIEVLKTGSVANMTEREIDQAILMHQGEKRVLRDFIAYMETRLHGLMAKEERE